MKRCRGGSKEGLAEDDGDDLRPRYRVSAGILALLHVKNLSARFSPVHHRHRQRSPRCAKSQPTFSSPSLLPQSPSSTNNNSPLPSSRSRPRLLAMSWKLGKKSPKPASNTLTTDGDLARSTTPTPGNPHPHARSGVTAGLLTVDVSSAEGLALPSGAKLPSAVQNALASTEAHVAQSVSPSSVAQQRLAKTQSHTRHGPARSGLRRA